MHRSSIIFIFLSGFIISCQQSKPKAISNDWAAWGDSLIRITFDTLRNTLQKAIAEKGLPGAVAFCNTQALKITGMYSTEEVVIKRIADKIRNPANRPDSLEQRILNEFKKRRMEGSGMKSIVHKDEAGNQHYFKPIIIQSFCLSCHGDKNNHIAPDTWTILSQKYLSDSAFGYKEGDLRGIWHITFSPSKTRPQK